MTRGRSFKLTVMGLSLTAALGISAKASDTMKKEAEKAMQDQMAKMMEAGTPGEDHSRLKALEGKWATKSKFWMKPGDKAEESMGTSEFMWVLGGRFLRQDVSGDWGGQKFEGMGFIGYDKIRQEYTSTWMDSMSTGLAYATGRFDEKIGMIKDEGSASCPMTGEKNRWFRGEWTMPKNDSHTYVMYSKDEKGKEFKSMEIVYTRMQ